MQLISLPRLAAVRIHNWPYCPSGDYDNIHEWQQYFQEVERAANRLVAFRASKNPHRLGHCPLIAIGSEGVSCVVTEEDAPRKVKPVFYVPTKQTDMIGRTKLVASQTDWQDIQGIRSGLSFFENIGDVEI